MTKQTKLVNCGSTVFVYDFKSRRKVEELDFEQDALIGNITNLERLLLTNFIDDRLLATFCLRVSLDEHEHVQDRLDLFLKNLKKSSRHRQIRYLAVTDIPSKKRNEAAYIHLITDIEIYELTIASKKSFLEEEVEEYFEGIWGDKLLSTCNLLKNYLQPSLQRISNH